MQEVYYRYSRITQLKQKTNKSHKLYIKSFTFLDAIANRLFAYLSIDGLTPITSSPIQVISRLDALYSCANLF